MTIPKHPLHAQFDEILAEIFEVKDNWYFSKINFVSSFSLPIISVISSSNSKIRDRFFFCCHWLLKEMTELFKVKPRPNFLKDDKNMNWTSSVPFLKRRSVRGKSDISMIADNSHWYILLLLMIHLQLGWGTWVHTDCFSIFNEKCLLTIMPISHMICFRDIQALFWVHLAYNLIFFFVSLLGKVLLLESVHLWEYSDDKWLTKCRMGPHNSIGR